MQTDPITIGLIIFAAVVLCIYYYRQFSKWRAEQKDLTWPLKVENCPDYWNENSPGQCENVLNLPTGDCGANGSSSGGLLKSFSFKSGPFTGEDGDKHKCNWSKKCKTSWEGIDTLCA